MALTDQLTDDDVITIHGAIGALARIVDLTDAEAAACEKLDLTARREAMVAAT